MATIKNAWGKLRESLAKAVRAPRTGLSRLGGTAPIQKTRSGFGRVGTGIGNATAGIRSRIDKTSRTVRGGVANAVEAPRDRIEELIEEAREHPTLAVGIAAGALVGVAWIIWAIYVTASNGATAGLGVLITWPVLIGALALVAAPFVLTAILVQRHRGASEPAMAGGPSIADEPAAKTDEKTEEPNASEAKAEDVAEDDDEADEEEEAA